MVDKNKDKFDIDTMNIKDHLDASFDIDKIKVSEDLIAKTLLAIKDSEKECNKSENTTLENSEDILENSNDSNDVIDIKRKKKSDLKFLPLKLATIAAAVFIFVVGMQSLEFGGSKKDSGYGISMNKGSSENSTADINGTAGSDKMAEDNQRIESSMNDAKEYAIKSEAVEENVKEEDTTVGSLSSEEDEYNKEALDGNAYILSSFYPIDNKVISEFTVKDEHDNLISTANNTYLVKELYAILDEYPLTMIENKTLDYNYQFDILTDEGQSYTILIGSGIYVKTSDELEFTYYEINDSDELLIKLEDFISTMP